MLISPLAVLVLRELGGGARRLGGDVEVLDPLAQSSLRVERVLHLEEGAQRETGEGRPGGAQIREGLVDARARRPPSRIGPASRPARDQMEKSPSRRSSKSSLVRPSDVVKARLGQRSNRACSARDSAAAIRRSAATRSGLRPRTSAGMPEGTWAGARRSRSPPRAPHRGTSRGGARSVATRRPRRAARRPAMPCSTPRSPPPAGDRARRSGRRRSAPSPRRGSARRSPRSPPRGRAARWLPAARTRPGSPELRR